MSCTPNVSIVIEKLQLFLEIDINHFFYPESVHLPHREQGDRSNKSSWAPIGRSRAQPGRFPRFFACYTGAWQDGRAIAHPHLKFSILVWNHPAFPWWERGWGWGWECLLLWHGQLVQTTISFRSNSQQKLLGDRPKFLGGLAPKKPNPSHKTKIKLI